MQTSKSSHPVIWLVFIIFAILEISGITIISEVKIERFKMYFIIVAFYVIIRNLKV